MRVPTVTPFEIFKGLPPEVVEERIARLPSREFAAGEVLLRENDPNQHVFLVESGELDVWKGEPNSPRGVRVAQLRAGDCFGEMSALNGAPSSATVVAGSAARVKEIGLGDLPADQGVRETVTLNLARTLIQRLTRANASIQEKHERELEAQRVINAAGGFVTRMLTALTCYMFCLPLMAALIPLLPSNSLISFFFIAAFGWVAVNFMNQHPEVWQRWWHMTRERWVRQLGRGLLWTVPPLLVFAAIKFSFMYARPGQYEFFEPMTAIKRGDPMNWPLWTAFAIVYTGLSFAQEFIRCAVQGTIAMLNAHAPGGGAWKAILLSDIVFASIHLHLGVAFAIQAFIGGLFFGYQFYKERSYLSVAFTHSLVGVFCVFIAGIPK